MCHYIGGRLCRKKIHGNFIFYEKHLVGLDLIDSSRSRFIKFQQSLRKYL